MKRNLLFLSKNLLKMALLLLCVSMVAFFLVSVSPINPLQANVGQTALGSMSPEQIQKLEEYWGVGRLRWSGISPGPEMFSGETWAPPLSTGRAWPRSSASDSKTPYGC